MGASKVLHRRQATFQRELGDPGVVRQERRAARDEQRVRSLASTSASVARAFRIQSTRRSNPVCQASDYRDGILSAIDERGGWRGETRAREEREDPRHRQGSLPSNARAGGYVRRSARRPLDDIAGWM